MDPKLLGQSRESLLPEAQDRASAWLAAEMKDHSSGFYCDPRRGFARGIEFFSGFDLHRITARAIAIHASGVGRWADLENPVCFTDKLLWLKFFGFLPIPNPANKLAVGGLVPTALRTRIKVPKVVWRSDRPMLPRSAEVEPGSYFLKSNNGTANTLRLDFPLNQQDEFLAKAWAERSLQRPRIVAGGEWWYGTFKPEVFLEVPVAKPGSFQEWKLMVMNGKYRRCYERVGDERSTISNTLYDADFNHIPVGIGDYGIGKLRQPFKELELMREAAEALAANVPFGRVDFYLTAKHEVFVGEVTYCPNNTRIRYSDPEFDYIAGRDLDLSTCRNQVGTS